MTRSMITAQMNAADDGARVFSSDHAGREEVTVQIGTLTVVLAAAVASRLADQIIAAVDQLGQGTVATETEDR